MTGRKDLKTVIEIFIAKSCSLRGWLDFSFSKSKRIITCPDLYPSAYKKHWSTLSKLDVALLTLAIDYSIIKYCCELSEGLYLNSAYNLNLAYTSVK